MSQPQTRVQTPIGLRRAMEISVGGEPRRTAVRSCGVDVVSAKWRKAVEETVGLCVTARKGTGC